MFRMIVMLFRTIIGVYVMMIMVRIIGVIIGRIIIILIVRVRIFTDNATANPNRSRSDYSCEQYISYQPLFHIYSRGPNYLKFFKKPQEGIEPPTFALRKQRSAN